MPPSITDLETLIAFNDQLLALDEAGVPSGFPGSSKELAAELEKINGLLARRVSRGEPIEQALELEFDVPKWYRTLALSAIKSGNMETTLRDFTAVAIAADQSQYVSQSAMFYPLIVVTLAYCGIVGFCLFFVPSLQSAYASLRIPAGSGLTILEFLRSTLPFWIAIPPILLLLLIVRQIRKRRYVAISNGALSGILARLSGAARALDHERSACLAESIASFNENGVPLDEAIALASGASRPSAIPNQTNRTTPIGTSDQQAVAGPQNRIQFPPFLRWALFESEPAIVRHRALEMAAGLYRQASIHAMRRARIIAPIILLVTIGGTVTLLYGLALFIPVVQMLKAVALSPIKGA
jgi:type II secretory pathway component PulF